MRVKSTVLRLGLGVASACAAIALVDSPESRGAPVSGDEPRKETAAVVDKSKLPPLIDRELLFGDPKVSGAQISPDGRWITFLKPHRDVLNVWVKKRDEPFSTATPLTADTTRPVTGYFWTEDSRFVLYVQDKGGDENFHVYAVDPAGEAEAATGAPAARDLTPLDGVRAMIYALPEKTPEKIVVGLNDRDPAMHDVYLVDIATGDRELLVTNDSNVAQWTVDREGSVRLAWRQTADGGSEILLVEQGRPGKSIYSCSFEETCTPYRFHKDGRGVYIISDKGGDVNLSRLLLLDVTTGKAEVVDSDPERQVDFGGALFSDKTEELIGTVYVGDRVRIYPRTQELARDIEFLRDELPDGELSLRAGTKDERFRIIAVSSDVNPGSAWLYDRRGPSVEKLYDSRPELPAEDLAHVEPVSYEARDGLRIPGYLTLPRGAPPKKLPTVIFPHGGPWARDMWGFDPFAQLLANRGYAVLQPNFRGSTGYGKTFLNAGNEEWGTGAMQHDLTDGVKYLVERGIADPDRVAIMGGSYGGYAALAGMAFTPDVYAAGVSIVGPSSIITLLESIPPYWGPLRKIFEKRVGDPSDPADRERLIAQSPLFRAKEIKSPLLVIQGANDPRVKQAESDQIVVALRDLDRQVEYFVAEDEGHGFAGEENRLAMIAVIEEFLATHLGGRYQEDASPAVAERVEDLRVDISKVTLKGESGAAKNAETAPLPLPAAGSFSPGTSTYASVIALPGGREMSMRSTNTVVLDESGERPVWRIETSAESPLGAATDTYVLDRENLLPLSRRAVQGPVIIDLSFGAGKVQGSIESPMGEMSIDQKLQAPVFSSGAALEATLGALPLEAGFETPYRTFDPQSASVRLWSFRVEALETVEVPAGRFEAFVCTVKSLDDSDEGGRIWISVDPPRRILKTEYAVPTPMGRATVTSTLQRIGTN
jgi:dipeptidyl aminopeptidase/acylaminoacyl peptidase